MKAIIVGAIGAVLGCALGIVLVVLDGMPPEASVQAHNTDWIYQIMLVTTSGIFGLVTAVLVVAIFQFRAKHGEMRDAAPVHGHTGLEIIWTIIPTIIVVALTGLSWKVLNDNNVADASGHLTVSVWGQKWDWNYDYPTYSGSVTGAKGTFPYMVSGIHELTVPINTPIRFEVRSRDVIHGWWVPEWRVQINATPGQTNILSATPNKTGWFPVVCTFVCGDAHPKMGTEVAGAFPSRIRVVSQAEFATYMAAAVAQAKKDAADPDHAAVVAFSGCAGCHTWTPAKATGTIGPSLDALAADATSRGLALEAFVRESIVNPSAFVNPSFKDGIMPANFGTTLTKDQIDALVTRIAADSKK